jgi:hypothetical protein
MSYEERRVVTDEPAGTVRTESSTTEPTTVVEKRPRTVVTEDPVGDAYAASQLIQTIVWSIVVLVLLVVALWALHVYAHLF